MVPYPDTAGFVLVPENWAMAEEPPPFTVKPVPPLKRLVARS
jgi:hypothetical protein